MSSFGQRLEEAMARHGQLCVGIDPHPALIDEWGLPQSGQGVRDFGLRVVDAASGQVAAIKPQVAFFERFGSAGFAALEEILLAAKSAELLSIADAKRGDIGSTMAGYGSAWLEPGAPLEADALTLSPYLGAESLRESTITAIRHEKGVFVLAATSNQEAFPIQSANTHDVCATDSETVAARVIQDATWPNHSAAFESVRLGPVGVVIGATVSHGEYGLSEQILRKTPILAPGFGAQGVSPASLRDLFGALAPQVLANESRSILSAGLRDLSSAVASRAREYRGLRD
jgi:orotidine-5'-phosphate decarboxylase